MSKRILSMGEHSGAVNTWECTNCTSTRADDFPGCIVMVPTGYPSPTFCVITGRCFKRHEDSWVKKDNYVCIDKDNVNIPVSHYMIHKDDIIALTEQLHLYSWHGYENTVKQVGDTLAKILCPKVEVL